jgi:hypothetical protein
VSGERPGCEVSKNVRQWAEINNKTVTKNEAGGSAPSLRQGTVGLAVDL